VAVPKPTVDVGGEDDGAFGAGRASDIGPESPREVVFDLASFYAALREVRRVVEALRVLMNGRRRSDVHCDDEEEQCSGDHHGTRHGGSAQSVSVNCQLLLRCWFL